MTKQISSAKKAKKTAGTKKTGAKDRIWENFAKELRDLIPKLDAEGLAFLVEQARVHLYNMQVDELNKAAHAADTASARAKNVKAAVSGGKKGRLSFDSNESGTHFYLNYNNDNAIFSKDEITSLVKLVYGGETDMEVHERLYNWLYRERRDVFSFIPIADKFDDHIKALAKLIKKDFKLKR
jgi:hypothetical protein